MIANGVLENRKVDGIFSFHLWNPAPVGSVIVQAGPIWAGVDQIRIRIVGHGGHGATPHQAIDPIPAASQIVMGLQTLVSRESKPTEPVVISVTALQAGTTWNVIPGEAVLQGTMRTFNRQQRDKLVERAEDLVRGICLATRTEYEFQSNYIAPPVVNDETMTHLAHKVATRELGVEQVLQVDQSTLGDDMAFFLERVPGCYIMVGSGNQPRGLDAGHHSPQFDFDEESLAIGTRILVATALEYLGKIR